MEGRVRDFSERGWGFLVFEDLESRGPRYVFCHHRAIVGQQGYRSLPVGGYVEFEIAEDHHGKHATNVRLLADPEPAETAA